MRFFAVYGNPIAHSKSPLLHNFIYEKYGISAYYGRIMIQNAKALPQSFKMHHLSGANITVPFKEDAFRFCDAVRGIAKDIGACNTWVKEKGRVIGYNTDAQGFYECIKDFGIKTALIIGAGGSAKAVAFALKAHHIDVTLINRSEAKLTFFADKGFQCHVSDAFMPTSAYDIIINTTSAGLNDATLPCKETLLDALFANSGYAFDLIYGKCTPFLQKASAHKISCIDGKQMLIYQAALACKLFLPEYFDNIESSHIATLMHKILV